MPPYQICKQSWVTNLSLYKHCSLPPSMCILRYLRSMGTVTSLGFFAVTTSPAWTQLTSEDVNSRRNFFADKTSRVSSSITIFGPGNTKGGKHHCTIDLLFDWFGFSLLQIYTKIVSCHTANSKPVKQEVDGTVILPPLVFPVWTLVKG